MQKMLVRLNFISFIKTHDSSFCLGQFIENQLPEQVSLQTFMEDLLKMPTQYVDQVMYSIREQLRQSSLHPTREQNRPHTIEQQPFQQQHHQQQQQQQRLRSSVTATTQSTTSASNES